jgi:hypothetical protein
LKPDQVWKGGDEKEERKKERKEERKKGRKKERDTEWHTREKSSVCASYPIHQPVHAKTCSSGSGLVGFIALEGMVSYAQMEFHYYT